MIRFSETIKTCLKKLSTKMLRDSLPHSVECYLFFEWFPYVDLPSIIDYFVKRSNRLKLGRKILFGNKSAKLRIKEVVSPNEAQWLSTFSITGLCAYCFDEVPSKNLFDDPQQK